MQDTRQQILEILKRRGEVTVQDLSNELGLTSVTVRHHLEILRSEGYITDPEVRRSNRPGRPRYVYRLTSTAADLFPNNYSGLASALLDAMHECISPETYTKMIEKTAEYMAEDADQLPDDPEERIESVTTFLNQHGFVARWEEQEAGRYHIIISSCPYHHVSQRYDEPCMVDYHMIKSLVGGDVERLQNEAKTSGLCVYEVKFPDSSG
jgi:predicted ArsR family transcriptional regulator